MHSSLISSSTGESQLSPGELSTPAAAAVGQVVKRIAGQTISSESAELPKTPGLLELPVELRQTILSNLSALADKKNFCDIQKDLTQVNMARLQALRINTSGIEPGALRKSLGKMENLRSIGLSGEVSATHLDALAALDQLEYLDLHQAHIIHDTGNALEALGKLPMLKYLSLQHISGICAEQLDCFQSLQSIEHLQLLLPELEPAETLTHLGNMPGLITLRLNNWHKLRGLPAQFTQQFPNLKYLDLNDCKLATASLRNLGNLEKLVQLKLSYLYPDTLNILNDLKDLPTLRCLSLNVCDRRMTGDLEAIIQLKNLQRLTLSYIDIVPDHHLFGLVAHPRLEEIRLTHVRNTEGPGLVDLRQLPTLRRLYVNRHDMLPDNLQHRLGDQIEVHYFKNFMHNSSLMERDQYDPFPDQRYL